MLNATNSAIPAYLIVVLNDFVEEKDLWEGHLRIKCKMQNAECKIIGEALLPNIIALQR